MVSNTIHTKEPDSLFELVKFYEPIYFAHLVVDCLVEPELAQLASLAFKHSSVLYGIVYLLTFVTVIACSL